MWIDTHCHLQMEPLADRLVAVLAAGAAQGIVQWVTNGTCVNDWAAVADLAEKYNNRILPSFGVHPWQAADAGPDWPRCLEEYLMRYPEAGVGEIGLDRWVKSPPIEDQLPVFEAQWRLAVEMGRPITVHCLRAWEDLLQSMRRLPPHPGRVLIHAYGGSEDAALELLEAGCYFSFNGHFFKPGKERVLDWWRRLPEDRLLLESDAPSMRPPPQYLEGLEAMPDGANHPASLAACAEELARQRGTPVDRLLAIQTQNFQRWWRGILQW